MQEITPAPQTFFEKAGHWVRNSITLRLFTIGILVLLLLIPVSMIEGLIQEREFRQGEAQKEISDKWGQAQTVKGLVLSVPFLAYEKMQDKDNTFKTVEVTRYYHFLPETLAIHGTLDPSVRYRGLFETIVYGTSLQMTGNFPPLHVPDASLSGRLMWDKAFLSLGLSDLRSISDEVKVNWNGTDHSFEPGIASSDVSESGISVPVAISPDTGSATNYVFRVSLKFNGSNSLFVVPLGKTTDVTLASQWKDPSFDGAFLPDARQVNDSGFNATWKVLNLNRSYPQQFVGSVPGIDESAFGVSLRMPVDQYQKSMRAAKYAVLFIALTFMVFFFIQILHKVRVHPIQYILVGFALCLFYTLLISLSEHLMFGLAYFLASVAIVGLTAFYAHGTFKSMKLTGMLASVMSILYGFIFIIIQLEDFALLAGSIGLFVALALVMALTRKIDWYGGRK